MNPIACYETIIDVAQPNILQGDANSQTTTNMLKMNPTQGTNPNVRAEGMALGYFSLLNRSGGAASVGIGVRIPNHLWSAGQWVDATTTYTDDTTDAQDVGGVVQGRQRVEPLDGAGDLVVDQYRLSEPLPAVHHPVAHGAEL